MKNLIFCVNSGRAGTQYLCNIFKEAEDTLALHEAEPYMSYGFTNLVNNHPYAQSYEKRKVKISAIREKMKQLPSHFSYVETNHMFIKTFFDVVLDEFKQKVGAVILRRPISQTLKSFYELDYSFGKFEEIFNWMTRADAVTAAIKCIKPFKAMDEFERTIAYLIDIEARAVRFSNVYKQNRIYNVKLSELNDIQKVKEMFGFFGMKLKNDTCSAVGKKANERTQHKDKVKRPIELNYCVERCHQYIKEAERMGIKVPSTIMI